MMLLVRNQMYVPESGALSGVLPGIGILQRVLGAGLCISSFRYRWYAVSLLAALYAVLGKCTEWLVCLGRVL